MKLNKVALIGIISLVAVIAAAGIAGAAYGDKRGFRGTRLQALQTNQQITCGNTAGDCAQTRGWAAAFAQGWGGKGFALLESAADLLGLEPQKLKEELRSGKTLQDLVSAQGIDKDKFVQDLVSAATAKIDQAVQNGKISSEQATEIKANLSQCVQTLLTEKWVEGKGRGNVDAMMGIRGKMPEIFEQVQALLGIDATALKTELQSGKSLAEISKDKGISQDTLIEKIQTAITANLDQAAADKKITAEAAAKIKENLTQRITDMVTRKHPPRQTVPGPTASQAKETSNT
ncbi:MAG TPA: hypothetical protein VN374_07210 [Desulfitobacteriaceae bacterium]|nr:hypothetical protein [Desulfitobacteriaceae bacterium]